MKKEILIVESPNKVKKIQKFLDEEYGVEKFKVLSSVGHLRDLKTYGTYLRLGLDIENMDPIYINLKEKNKVIDEINKYSNYADNIYLATDPDREGEAISWHIKEIIENKKANFKRVIFNEITKKAIVDSINNSIEINMNLVHSQEARRILDRIIGFRLTFITNKKIKAPSAGRVKSSVLKLIIDRENEIKKFKPEFWWKLEGFLEEKETIVNVTKELKEKKYSKKEKAEEVLKKLSKEFIFFERKEKEIKIPKPKPFELSSLLISAFNKFGFSNARVSSIAQKLYEKGFISYPRTDSTRISSKDFLFEIEKFIKNKYGKDEFEIQNFKTKNKNDQDAHEAIRPTNIKDFEKNLSSLQKDEQKIYELIYKNTLKSFMKDGINLSINDFYKNKDYFFEIKKSFIKKTSFRIIDNIFEEKEIPKPLKKIYLDGENIKVIEYSTKAPSRYNQASIIKKMKSLGIGRPSTYSNTTSGLLKYNYLNKGKRNLVPTELAFEVNDLLLKYFGDVINENYTSNMELTLDDISKGTIEHKNYLKTFWSYFEPKINFADETIEKKPDELVGRSCHLCKEGDLIYKKSRYGKFIGCSNWPSCKYIEKINEPPQKIVIEELKCEKCNSDFLLKKSRYNSFFIACSNFPKCKNILEKEKAKPLIEKYSKK